MIRAETAAAASVAKSAARAQPMSALLGFILLSVLKEDSLNGLAVLLERKIPLSPAPLHLYCSSAGPSVGLCVA